MKRSRYFDCVYLENFWCVNNVNITVFLEYSDFRMTKICAKSVVLVVIN